MRPLVVRPDFRGAPHGRDPPVPSVERGDHRCRHLTHARLRSCPMHNEATVVAGVVTELRDRVPASWSAWTTAARDDSAAVARAAGAVVVPHPTNLGQGAALETGHPVRAVAAGHGSTSSPSTPTASTTSRTPGAMVERAGLPRPAGGAGLPLPRRVEGSAARPPPAAARGGAVHPPDHGAGAHRRPQRTARAAPRRRRGSAAPAARHVPRQRDPHRCWHEAASPSRSTR